MKCFYHSRDMDGRCSGAIVREVFPECELIGYDYGQPFPWETIHPEEQVFLVDVSLQPFSDMVRLNAACRLTWIDHHVTAIAARDEVGVPFDGIQRVGRAGCELTWDYLMADGGWVPRAVHLLGRYDVWQWQDVPGAMEFQSGMWQFNSNPVNSELWHRLFHDDGLVDEIIHNGGLLLAAKRKDNSSRIKALGFDTELDGLRCIAVNHGMTNSTVFDEAYDPDRHDAMLAFAWYRDHWKVSLYSAKDEVDVSQICKVRGGGGHRGAAGFQCRELPFVLGV